jgi:hypothetical protein
VIRCRTTVAHGRGGGSTAAIGGAEDDSGSDDEEEEDIFLLLLWSLVARSIGIGIAIVVGYLNSTRQINFSHLARQAMPLSVTKLPYQCIHRWG